MTKLKTRFVLAFIALIIGGAAGYAIASDAHNHANNSDHSVHMTAKSDVPTEQGQSAFAAIAEIVSILESDPDTDWSKVDINALRKHLVDMSALTLEADVSVLENESSITFNATGTDVILRALQNMVPAHASELNKMDEWDVNGVATNDGAVLSVTPIEVSDLSKIKALGFFGLMATGSHHQPHHLGMAKGTMAH